MRVLLFDLIGGYKLYGMKAACDEIHLRLSLAENVAPAIAQSVLIVLSLRAGIIFRDSASAGYRWPAFEVGTLKTAVEPDLSLGTDVKPCPKTTR